MGFSFAGVSHGETVSCTLGTAIIYLSLVTLADGQVRAGAVGI